MAPVATAGVLCRQLPLRPARRRLGPAGCPRAGDAPGEPGPSLIHLCPHLEVGVRRCLGFTGVAGLNESMLLPCSSHTWPELEAPQAAPLPPQSSLQLTAWGGSWSGVSLQLFSWGVEGPSQPLGGSPASPLSLTTGDPGSAPTAHSEALSGQATHLVLTLWSLVHGQGGLWVFVEPGNVSSSRLLPESQEEGPKSTGSIQDSTGCVCTRLCV